MKSDEQAVFNMHVVQTSRHYYWVWASTGLKGSIHGRLYCWTFPNEESKQNKIMQYEETA